MVTAKQSKSPVNHAAKNSEGRDEAPDVDRAVVAATRPATPAAPPALAPVPRFFPAGGPHGRVVPFGRKGETLSEARLTRDLLRRAKRVCAASRARVENEIG